MKKVLDLQQMPMMLDVKDLTAILGLSRAGVYQLMHRKDFPTLKIGKRMLVPKDSFGEWIAQNIGNHGGQYDW